MNKAKLQRLFVDFILNEVGPNEEKEKERNMKYNLVKQIIENSLITNYPNYIPHLFLYGSFSLKQKRANNFIKQTPPPIEYTIK